ncbi:uncharacterized protein LAESUDRAFT_409254 [Laetiporus sulphureus 93-53]|uniref:Uncharacterized protein n=1 Tax=Laetiporus sulphureus 93-53 TaxID=1314785 RepID=A0A165CAB1_9APHY|nr:uncharacterized protein LAESUDRAFT_409254 [Laetiporus sulphureus 93-53]KZT02460.1 hypothetical protein LAESUDRAFT_409254 [Laetiporus sulphureus 93-53]
MASPDLSRRSLDTLPYDILLHILHCYGQNESVPKRYRLLFALSQVNHYLRFFALPLLAQEVAIPRWQDYLEAVKYVTGSCVKSGLLRAGSVRHIYIGHMSDSRCLRIDLARKLNEVPFPFHNLRSFSCGACVFRPYELQFLESAFRLTSLSIRWNNEWNFPDISEWPELCTLRLTVSGYDDICWSPPCEYRSFYSLTTLVMYELPGSYCSWWNHQSDNYTFPNLHVFRISRARNPPSVYHFVQRHPTLLEVNVRFMVTSRHLPFCRLSSLIKLIDGTGTWRMPPKELSPLNSCTHSFIPDHSILVDVPEYDEDTMTALGEELFMTCSAFAFKRIALHSEATQWDKPFGSPEPRYSAIEFAFQGQWWCEEQGVPMSCVSPHAPSTDMGMSRTSGQTSASRSANGRT